MSGTFSEANLDRVSPSKVLASAATGAAELFARQGGDVDAIFGNSGIRLDAVDDPVNELNLMQYCLLFEEAARATGNDNIGLEFGQGFQPKHLGAIGYAAINSPTLAAALGNLERYFVAHQGLTVFKVFQDADIFWLGYRIYDPRIEKRRQDAELSLGMFRNMFRAALGPDWSPLEVRFEHERTDSARPHEAAFGAPVRFGRRINGFAFRRRDLDARMPHADPYLFSIIRPFLESRCRLQESPEDIAAVVREQIKLHLGDKLPTVPEIARILGLSDRHLKNKLRDHGVAYGDLIKAARQELAMHYLRESEMPVTEIAYNLGYSEISAFSRAFRNWAGMSPQRYRRTETRGTHR